MSENGNKVLLIILVILGLVILYFLLRPKVATYSYYPNTLQASVVAPTYGYSNGYQNAPAYAYPSTDYSSVKTYSRPSTTSEKVYTYTNVTPTYSDPQQYITHNGYTNYNYQYPYTNYQNYNYGYNEYTPVQSTYNNNYPYNNTNYNTGYNNYPYSTNYNCPTDTMRCSNGSYVGRSGPYCAFTLCQ